MLHYYYMTYILLHCYVGTIQDVVKKAEKWVAIFPYTFTILTRKKIGRGRMDKVATLYGSMISFFTLF